MTIIELLLLVVVLIVIGLVAYWIITKFFPEPARMIALFIVGVLLLIVLIGAFFPGIGSFRIGR